MSDQCNNPEHDHNGNEQDLFEAIAEMETPEEIAGAAIQIFIAVAKISTQAGLLNPMLIKGFEPMKALSEKLGIQEITDLVITTEMEVIGIISSMSKKDISKSKHPAGKRKFWGNN